MDFGTLKNNFTNAFIESHLNNDKKGKILYKKFLKTIKESEALKSYFIVYKNIENKSLGNALEASEYLKENLNILYRFRGEKSVSKEITKLLEIIKESGIELNETPTKLHESLNVLLTSPKSVDNIDLIHESKNNVINWLTSNKSGEETNDNYVVDGINPIKFLDIAVNKFNEKYSNLTEEEKNIFKVITQSDVKEKEILFNKMVKESISLINNTLKEYGDNLDVKSKLLEVKDVIYNIEFNEDSYEKDISKIYELKKSLS